jgi:hypothetical protein
MVNFKLMSDPAWKQQYAEKRAREEAERAELLKPGNNVAYLYNSNNTTKVRLIEDMGQQWYIYDYRNGRKYYVETWRLDKLPTEKSF